MFDTEQEITTAIETRERDMDALRERMDDDFDLWALEEFTPVEGYEKYTASSPRNYFNKVIDGMARAIMTISIKLPEDASDKETAQASLGEQFLFGALAAIDRNLRRAGEPPLRNSLGFLEGLRGWMAMRALVYVPKDEADTVFDVVPWDMRHVTFQTGARGLIWAAYKRMVSAAQVLDEYGIDVGDKEDVAVIDFWDRERNSTIVNGVFHKDPTDHDIGHVPVFIGAVGAMPSMQEGMSGAGTSTGDTSLLEHRGNSVWHAVRGLYEPFNKYVAGLMDIVQRSKAGSLFHKTKSGKSTLEGDSPYESFKVVPGGLQDSLEPITLPPAAPETGALVDIIRGDIEQGSLPDPLSFGGTNAPESGRALAYRIDMTRSVYNPYTGMMAEGYTWLLEELLTQFEKKGIKKVELSGIMPSSTNKGKDEFFRATVKPSDVEPNWFVQVTMEPRLPRDQESEISMALAATQKRDDGQQLLSMRTAREEILQIPDPDAEENRILAEMGKTLPPIMTRRIAAELKDKGEDELATEVLGLLGQQGQQPGEPGAPVGPVGPEGPGGAPEIPMLLDALMKAFVTAGFPQIAEALLAVIQGGGQVPEQPIEPAGQGQPEAPVTSGLQKPMGGPGEMSGQPPVAGAQGPPPELIAVIQEIVRILGEGQLTQAIMGAMQSGQPLPPELVEAIVRALVQMQRQDLAAALLAALGVEIPQG